MLLLLPLLMLPLDAQPITQEQAWKSNRILPPWFVYELPATKERQPPLRLEKRPAPRGVPGATVEVVATVEQVRKERFQAFQFEVAPLVFQAFQIGASSPYTAEMLSEFMGMTADSFRPPTIPSVFYNATVPYWVQQGWDGPLTGLGHQRSTWSWGLSGQINDLHRPLIPGPVKR